MLNGINKIHTITLLILMVGIGLFLYQTIKCQNIEFIDSEREAIETQNSTWRILIGTFIISISEIIEIILLIKYKDLLAHKIFVITLVMFIIFGVIIILLHIKTYYLFFTYQVDLIEQKELRNFFCIISNLVVGGLAIITSSASLLPGRLISDMGEVEFVKRLSDPREMSQAE